MTRVSITRNINVRDPSANLPPSGAAKLIAPSGGHQAVRPAEMSEGQWNYCVFGSYGSGCFNPYYSATGAFVLSGSGGHGHPSMFGALVFDFVTRSWSYLANSNGVADRPTPIDIAETTGAPYYEMTGTQVPAPPHPYKNLSLISPSNGGATKGTMIYVSRASVTSISAESVYAHAFDLDTRSWVRKSTNGGRSGYEQDIVYDPVTNRYYIVTSNLHTTSDLSYLDGADWTFKTTASYPWPAEMQFGVRAWICEGGGKRVLMAWAPNRIIALNLGAISSGWVDVTANFVGTWPNQKFNGIVHHTGQGVYYVAQDDGALFRVTPPAGDPMAGTWTIASVVLTGDAVPAYRPRPNIDTAAYKSLFYIPSYQMLGWVTAGGVALLNP